MGGRVLVVSSPQMADHDPGRGHPDAPWRLEAVERGVAEAPLGGDLVRAAARSATFDELALVHPPAHLLDLERYCEGGGGWIEVDTMVGPASWPAARLAAGAGLEAVARLRAGDAEAAFCAVRPPGHHATPTRAMGFSLLSNVAVTAKHLAAAGERVLIVDIDVHHGNGTQDVIWDDPSIGFVSFHEWPGYPGTFLPAGSRCGRLSETGGPGAPGLVANLPFPPGTTGPAYRAAVDEVVVPMAERLAPTWLLLSAGFDAHRLDPAADGLLTAGDVADLTRELVALVPEGRTVSFLEGGYDPDSLRACTAAHVAALGGVDHRPEPASGGDRGMAVVERAVAALAAATT